MLFKFSYKLNFHFLRAIELQGTPSQHSWVAGAGSHRWHLWTLTGGRGGYTAVARIGDSQVRKDSQVAGARGFSEPIGAPMKREVLHGDIA